MLRHVTPRRAVSIVHKRLLERLSQGSLKDSEELVLGVARIVSEKHHLELGDDDERILI